MVARLPIPWKRKKNDFNAFVFDSREMRDFVSSRDDGHDRRQERCNLVQSGRLHEKEFYSSLPGMCSVERFEVTYRRGKKKKVHVNCGS